MGIQGLDNAPYEMCPMQMIRFLLSFLLLTTMAQANPFIGGTGVDAQRGLTFGKEFDRNKPFRFHPKEDSYWVELLDPQGNVHKAWGRFSPGYYAVIFVNSNGAYTIDFMGMIE